MAGLRFIPHGEDPGKIAGGDTQVGQRAKARPIAFTAGPPLGQSPATPPGEGKQFVGAAPRRSYTSKDSRAMAKMAGAKDEIENDAQRDAEDDGGDPNAAPPDVDFLALLREAESTSSRYVAQVNRRAWTQSYRAYNNQHFVGSKYGTKEYDNRSRFFRPKTRTAVKKDMAAVAASLFGNVDAVSCMAGNESDPRQRASAAVMEELINYRTDRSSGKAALPWWHVAMGARQDALMTSVCLSKQTWKLEVRQDGVHDVEVDDEETGEPMLEEQPRYVLETDRPDSQLIPPENYTIDPAADWTNPVQSAAYVIIKWPLHLQEVQKKQASPISPWLDVDTNLLLSNSDSGTTDTSAIRRSRELGMDRMDESQTGTKFQIVWVYEVYMRVDDEDYTFFSAGDRAYLTEPSPVREVYPEQFGERPLVLGYGNMDAHRLFPLSPVESWQQHQQMLNDIVNLRLDATKQNIMPVTKIKRGQQVDTDQVKKRSHGTSIYVNDKDDVTFDRPPDIPQSAVEMNREIELEMDDLAGQFNGQTTQANNSLSRTLGGLKLVAGSANAVQEYDIRVWIETWAQPVLAQLVRLEQYYEHDDVILGICGDRAQLLQKYGVSKITNDLIEQEVMVRVSVGLGAGDPQQRLQKFASALQIVAPIVAQAPEFLRGEREIDIEAICEEVFGSAGYRDGGARFFKQGTPKPQGDPLMDLKAAELKSKVTKNDQTGRAALLTAIAAAAKQALGERTAEDDMADRLVGRILEATGLGHEHGHRHNESRMAATDLGHRHGMDRRGQGFIEGQASQDRADRQAALPPPSPQAGGGGQPQGMSGPPPDLSSQIGNASSGPPESTSENGKPSSGPPGSGPGMPAAPPSGGPGMGHPGGPQSPGGGPAPPPQLQPSFIAKQAALEPAPPPDAGQTPTQLEFQSIRQGVELPPWANQ